MNKLRSIFLLGFTLLLSGCQFAILDPKGPIAASEKHLFLLAVGFMLIVVIPVILLSFIIPWRYRASNTKATYDPNWSHSTLLEVIWWSIPCVIIAILAWLTWVYTHKLDPYRPLDNPKKPLVIQAIALNWKWLFIYPAQGIATVNFVQIPVNQPILFLIASDAPMNSLEIPQLAGQIYAMTAMQTKLNLLAEHEGLYTGLSTNFSGEGFSGMTFQVKASSQDSFDAWVKQVKQSPKPLTVETYSALLQPSENDPVQYFSSPARGLFSMAIQKYEGVHIQGMAYMGSHLPQS